MHIQVEYRESGFSLDVGLTRLRRACCLLDRRGEFLAAGQDHCPLVPEIISQEDFRLE